MPTADGIDNMKAVILAGGIGSRLQEETVARPKPMIEVGGRPILWHIMKIYSHFGVKDFVICLGYRGYQIKEYFLNYVLHNSDVTIQIDQRDITFHNTPAEPWRVTLVDTGDLTMTGGRLKRIAPHIGDDPHFFMTYGDGVANVDIPALLAHHQAQGRKATMTVVKPPGRFGAVMLDNDRIVNFQEKPQGDGGYINGGFFVLTPGVFDLIAGDDTSFEQDPLNALAQGGDLTAYRHDGFWLPMDTARERSVLDELWSTGQAPWKLWH